MGFEPGGYADKLGNRFEGRWVVRQLIRLLHEMVRSVTIEAVGDDEAGVDLWITRTDGRREAQQCKALNGAKAEWSFADLARRGVLQYARSQLDRSPEHEFTLVSAVPATWLRDLSQSARDSAGDPECFFADQIAGAGGQRLRAFQDFCNRLDLDPGSPADRASAYDYLRRSHFHLTADDVHARDELKSLVQVTVAADPDVVIAALADFAQYNLRRVLIAGDIQQHLQQHDLPVRRLVADERTILGIDELGHDFEESVEPHLAAGRMIPRPEADKILSLLDADPSPDVVVLHGPAGFGKSGVLYQIVGGLKARRTPFIAVRLDRKPPRGTAQQFGKDLGLRDSPVISLEQIAVGRKAVLILDQLDALRWTSAHAAGGLDVCMSLLREVRSQRALGRELTMIVSCRTVDLENDPQIRRWLRRGNPRPFDRVEVRQLPELTVREVVAACGVDPGRLTSRRLSLLSSVQNLAMWAEIVRSGDYSPDFDSATQLMREFWSNRRREMEKAGVNSTERDAALNRLVDYMEGHATLSAPARLIERTEGLSTEMQTLGIVQVSGHSVTFCHQTYLDFLIADRAASSVNAGSMSVLDWLGDRARQSLFRREQLRQLLFLLADEAPAAFDAAVRAVLADGGTRFHIKQLVLEALGQFSEAESIKGLVLDLLGTERWADFVIPLIIHGNPIHVEELASRGILREWLASGEEALENRALWLLGSVSDRCSGVVAEHCLPYIGRGGDWPSRIASTFIRSNPAEDPEGLFALRLSCLRAGIGGDHIPWKETARADPHRAIELLAAIASTLPALRPRAFSRQSTLGIGDSDGWLAIIEAAACRPRLVWTMLLPNFVRLLKAAREQRRASRAGEYTSWQDRIRIPRVLTAVLRSAGRRLARHRPEEFLARSAELEKLPSRMARRMLAECFATLPRQYADFVMRWLLEDLRRLCCGSGRRRPRWLPASRLIATVTPYCSAQAFSELENTLLRYWGPDERRLFPWWLKLTREGIFDNRVGEAQYFLLRALNKPRRSIETTARIGVLERKFEGRGEEFFSPPRPRGGAVGSPLNVQRVEFMSDDAWLRIIANRDIPGRDGALRYRRYNRDSVIETSVEMLSRDFRIAAARQPSRFARLALRIPPDAPPDYFAGVLYAVARTSPPSEVPEERRDGWFPASTTEVQSVLEIPQLPNSNYVAKEYCGVLDDREDAELSPAVIQRLLRFASDPDPLPDELHIYCDQSAADCSVDVLEQNSINCVRSVAARTIAAVLFRRAELLPLLRPAVEQLIDDPHPVVRVASAGICLPMWNIDRDLAVAWLAQAAASDERVGACRHARELYNYAFPKYEAVLAPLIRRMMASPRAEVATVAAEQVTARWLFFGLFDDELNECCTGSVAQRTGVAGCASRHVTDPEYSDSCRPLVATFFDDPDENVRKQAMVMLRLDGLLAMPEAGPLLQRFVRSAAFRDDPSELLHDLKQSDVSLLQFADVLFDACKEFCQPRETRSPTDGNRFVHAGGEFSPLLLRLYEQSEGPAAEPIRQRCLDAWDELLENHVGTAWSLTRQLDR